MLCDSTIQTDHVIKAIKPVIIKLDKNHMWVKDIAAVPGGGMIKENEKREKQ